MTRPYITLAAAFGLALASMAGAQTTTDGTAAQTPAEPPATTDAETAPGTDLSMGAPADDGIGSTYVVAKFDDWEHRCVRTADGSDPCQLYQLLKDAQGNPVVEISIFGLPEGGQAVAGATIVVPLETLLTANLTMQVDSGAAKKYPFTWCAPVGCIARVGFTAEEVASLKKGVKASLTIIPVVAPDQKVVVDASLKGFTKGFEAVNAASVANADKAKGAAAEPAPAGN